MSQPAFAPERGEIWYSDGTSGFYALKIDEHVWPFRTPGEPAPAAAASTTCRDTRLGRRAARSAAASALGFRAARELPVHVDVFRVSTGRRVLRERLVARFRQPLARRVAWNGRGRRTARGVYFVRFRMMRRDGRYDTQPPRPRADARRALPRAPAALPPRLLRPAAQVQARAPRVRRPPRRAAAPAPTG